MFYSLLYEVISSSFNNILFCTVTDELCLELLAHISEGVCRPFKVGLLSCFVMSWIYTSTYNSPISNFYFTNGMTNKACETVVMLNSLHEFYLFKFKLLRTFKVRK